MTRPSNRQLSSVNARLVYWLMALAILPLGFAPPSIAEAGDTWSGKAPMPTARWGLGVGVVNGVLYAVGGGNSTGALTTVEAYDPASNIECSRARGAREGRT